MEKQNLLIELALDLTLNLNAKDRLQRLLSALRKALGADAAALILIEDNCWKVRASHGLNRAGQQLKWSIGKQARLKEVFKSQKVIVFPWDSELEDPFDGFLSEAPNALHFVHSCLGIPLKVEGKLLGCLTADALELGAFDDFGEEFLNLLGALGSAILKAALERELLEKEASQKAEWARSLQREKVVEEVGMSEATVAFQRDLDLVASSPFPLLLQGETGVGKEVAARRAHQGSKRADLPFVVLNCAAIPASVVESELFGHTKGAFTGADNERLGRFEIADKGTLFLDEIGELPLEVQSKLLRVLQEGEVQRVGSDELIKVDVRLLAATNRSLADEVNAGRFRADLFHRLAVFPLTIPPLRNRREDIPQLVTVFLKEGQAQLQIPKVSVSKEAMKWFCQGEWRGNIRELKNVIQAGVLRSHHRCGDDTIVEIKDLEGMIWEPEESIGINHSSVKIKVEPQITMKESVERHKKTLLQKALSEWSGNQAKAAKALGMDRSNFHTQCKKLGLF